MDALRFEAAERLVGLRVDKLGKLLRADATDFNAGLDVVSAAGSRYWFLASTRYVDLVILGRRAYAAFRALSKTLRQLDTSTAAVGTDPDADEIAESQRIMRDDLLKLEKLQVDFMTVRQRFWIDTVPGREIDSKLLRALRDDFGVTDLYHEFYAELEVRERIVHTQYEQLQIERNQRESQRRRDEEIAEARRQKEEDEAEAQRQNALNFGIAILAAGLAGPDWAEAVVEDPAVWQIIVAAVLAGLITFVVLWGISRLVDIRRTRQRGSKRQQEDTTSEGLGP